MKQSKNLDLKLLRQKPLRDLTEEERQELEDDQLLQEQVDAILNFLVKAFIILIIISLPLGILGIYYFIYQHLNQVIVSEQQKQKEQLVILEFDNKKFITTEFIARRSRDIFTKSYEFECKNAVYFLERKTIKYEKITPKKIPDKAIDCLP